MPQLVVGTEGLVECDHRLVGSGWSGEAGNASGQKKMQHQRVASAASPNVLAHGELEV